MPLYWDCKDKDDSSNKGRGAEADDGHESGDCPPSQGSDGDTKMTYAPGSGSVADACKMHT